jgi:hypothetical protein
MSRLAAAVLLAALFACGVKAPPRPPIEPKGSPSGEPPAAAQGRDR